MVAGMAGSGFLRRKRGTEQKGSEPSPYPGFIVTLREFENRDEPRRAVTGTPHDVAPPEWVTGPTTSRERAVRLAQGGPTALGLIARAVGALVAAIGSALR